MSADGGGELLVWGWDKGVSECAGDAQDAVCRYPVREQDTPLLGHVAPQCSVFDAFPDPDGVQVDNGVVQGAEGVDETSSDRGQ